MASPPIGGRATDTTEGSDIDAAGWDERYKKSDLVWSAGPNTFVVEQVAGLAPGRAIDLAGGEGRNAIWLAEQGWDAELVEFSAVAIEKAAAIAHHRGVPLRTTLADVTSAPALEPADLVLVCYLQLPNASLTPALAHAATLVAPGGTLLVIAHERDNLEHGYGGPSDPTFLPTVAEVLAAIDGQGLLVEHAAQAERRVETDEGPRQAIDLIVRASRPASAPPA